MGRKADAVQEQLEVAQNDLAHARRENVRLRSALDEAAARGFAAPDRQRRPVEPQYEPPQVCGACRAGELEGVAEGEASYSCGHFTAWPPLVDGDTVRDVALARTDAGGGLRVVLDAGGHPIETVMSAADRHVARGIAQQLGLSEDADDLASISQALQQLHHGRVDPAMVKDTFAESVEHNRRERSQLLDELTAARAIISRVAAALQVGDWNKATGDELVERAQRYQGLTHWLKKRAGEISKADRDAAPEVLAEINTIITMMVAPAELARWVSKQPASRPTSPAVNALALEPASASVSLTVSQIVGTIIEWWTVAIDHGTESIRKAAADRTHPVAVLLAGLQANPDIAVEFINLVNVVVMPMLAKRQPRTAP